MYAIQTNPWKKSHVMVAQKQWDENGIQLNRVTIPASLHYIFRDMGGV